MMDNTQLLFMGVLVLLFVLVYYKPKELFDQPASETNKNLGLIGDKCGMGGKTCDSALWCVSNTTGRLAVPFEKGECKECKNINKNDLLSWGSMCQ